MYNSSKQKMNLKQKINFEDLSSTSSEFFSDYNEKKYIKQKGGHCYCMDMFKSISNKNFELILYILKQNNCCFKCQNKDGNTILHLLVQLYNLNDELKDSVDSLLKTNCLDFINIQNNQGQTPILLAVMDDNDILAEKLENAGADGSIEDINGNFVGSKNNETKSNESDAKLESELDSVPIKNIYNVFNIIIHKEQEKEQELESLGINNLSESYFNSNSDFELNTDNFMKKIKKNINNDEDESSSSSSEYIELPIIETSESSVSSMNPNKFITLLDENNNPSFINYSNIEDTDNFITVLRNKYSSNSDIQKKNIIQNTKLVDSSNKLQNPNFKSKTNLLSETTSDNNLSGLMKSQNPRTNLLDEMTSDSNISELMKLQNHNFMSKPVSKPASKPVSKPFINSNTSLTSLDSNKSTNTNLFELANQTTSDDFNNSVESAPNNKFNSKTNIFFKNDNKTVNQKKSFSSSDMDTNTLLNVIKKIQNNNENDTENDRQVGGKNIKKQQIIGHRKFNGDSDISFIGTNKNNLSDESDLDYNKLYNSDSEYGKKNKEDNKNELWKMMSRQKENLHNDVLEMIMGMLNKGLLTQSNKPIEASEKNAKLVKAYIYRYVSEKNPEMGGMDKILSIKRMDDNEIINIVKKMPDLNELEDNIKKHLDNKKSSNDATNTKSDKNKSSKKSSKKSS